MTWLLPSVNWESNPQTSSATARAPQSSAARHRHPDVVRKLVLASVTYTMEGVHPGLMEGFGEMKPEMMHGSPASRNTSASHLIRKTSPSCLPRRRRWTIGSVDLPVEAIRAIKAPTLLIIGDSDLVRPEHAVEMFRPLGGGVFGDTPAGPAEFTARHPAGDLYVTLVSRADLLLPMINTVFSTRPCRMPRDGRVTQPFRTKRTWSAAGVPTNSAISYPSGASVA